LFIEWLYFFPFIFPNMYDLLQARFATHLLVF
jgi:hypothetical protein